MGLGLDLAFLPAGVSIPGLSSIVGLVVKALLGDFLKNSRLLGNLEDRVFGLIGGVSPGHLLPARDPLLDLNEAMNSVTVEFPVISGNLLLPYSLCYNGGKKSAGQPKL